MINYQKNHTFKSSLVKFLLCFSFLLIITKPSVSEDLNIILIDQSIQCQAQLDVGFKDMFISSENKYLIKININDSRVKTTFNKGGFNFHHLIKVIFFVLFQYLVLSHNIESCLILSFLSV